jgi:signal transduction histidine kinase
LLANDYSDKALKEEVRMPGPSADETGLSVRPSEPSVPTSGAAQDAADEVRLAVRQEERVALADLLHDRLAQSLTAAHAHLDASRRRLGQADTERTARLLARSAELLEASVVEVRRLMAELREPVLDEAGHRHAVPPTAPLTPVDEANP